jgi:hypothetical protein
MVISRGASAMALQAITNSAAARALARRNFVALGFDSVVMSGMITQASDGG